MRELPKEVQDSLLRCYYFTQWDVIILIRFWMMEPPGVPQKTKKHRFLSGPNMTKQKLSAIFTHLAVFIAEHHDMARSSPSWDSLEAAYYGSLANFDGLSLDFVSG